MSFLAFIWPMLVVLNRRIFPGLRLSVLPVLAALGSWMTFRTYAGEVGTNVLSIVGIFLVEVLALCICFAWFAIRWHRLLLLNDPQTAIGGSFPPRALRRYTLRLFALVTAFLFCLLVIWMFTGGLVSGSAMAAWLRESALYLICFWVFYRFSPLLVGVPLGAPLSRGDAWRATRGTNRACLGLAVGTLVINSLLILPMTPTDAVMTPLEPIYIIVAFWVQVLVISTSVSVVHQHTVLRQ